MDAISLFVFWIILSVVVGIAANQKGRSWFGYFLLSLIVSPVIGLILVVILNPIEDSVVAKSQTLAMVDPETATAMGLDINPPQPSPPADNTTKPCPYCAETIKSAAIFCRFCNHDLADKQATEAKE